MKQKQLKNYLKLKILLFGICAFLIACEQDIVQEENLESKTENFFSKISFNTFKDQVKKEDIESSDINRLLKKPALSFGQLQFKSQSQNFVTSIDSTEVLVAEKNGITSYTFKTLTTDNTKTTNYVFAYDDNNNVDEYYITYENDGSSKIVEPTYGLEVTPQSNSVWCPITAEQLVCTCANPPHTVDECNGCDGWINITIISGYELCGSSPGEGNGGGPGNSGGTGNGNGESSGGNSGDGNTSGNDLPIDGEIFTKPLILDEEDLDEEELLSDCNLLENLSQNPDFTVKMQDLLNQTTQNTEVGYFGITDSNGTTTFPDNYRVEGEQNQRDIDIIILSNLPVNVFMHNHFNNGQGALSIFSGADLVFIYQLYLNGNITDTDNFVMLVATPGNDVNTPDDDTVYALTINDINAFASFGSLALNDPNTADIALFMQEENQISPNISSSLNEVRFLGALNSSNVGLTLYRGNRNNLNSWTRLKKKNNGTIKESNCN